MNVGKYLENVFKNIVTISWLFSKTAVIFGYDHSSDSSLESLKLFKRQNESDVFTVDILVNEKARHRHRTHNLEYIRNLMVSRICETYQMYDYFIMMDSDDVCATNIKTDVLHKHLTNNILWDSLSFNGRISVSQTEDSGSTPLNSSRHSLRVKTAAYEAVNLGSSPSDDFYIKN